MPNVAVGEKGSVLVFHPPQSPTFPFGSYSTLTTTMGLMTECSVLRDVDSMLLQEAQDLVRRGKSLSASSPDILDLGNDRVIKYGRGICKAEALAMQFVRERTSIPIPRVFAYASNSGDDKAIRKGYIVMEKLPGVALKEILKCLKQSDTMLIAKQLEEIVSELRTLDDPSRWGMIGKGGVFHGGFFSYGQSPAICRPCPPHAVADICGYFPASLRSIRRATYQVGGEYYNRIRPALIEHDSVFSHSDLRPENILVDPNTLRITGIVDWAGAGWYPRFWDRMVADRAYSSYWVEPGTGWKGIYEKVFPLYGEESKAFNMLLCAAGEWGEQDCGEGERCECCE